ncbi:hypothetical protein, partial [Streptomyces ossamyceticus]
QAPYGGQPGYPTVPQPPAAPGGGGKKVGIILGAVAVVAAVAVGAYFVFGGGSSDIADDGPHKLTTPASVLGEYKKSSGGGDGMTDEELKQAETATGIKNAKDVGANYEVKNESNPLGGKALTFGGLYGEIEDPEKAVDAFFVFMRKDVQKESDGAVTFKGSPKEYTPESLDGAVLKCQEATVDNSKDTSSGMPKEINIVYCLWGDYSTLGFAMPMEYSDIAAGKASTAEEVADITAKLRKEVRVAA